MPTNVTGFISDYDRNVHFDLHGAEFSPSFDSPEEYEAAAVAFLQKPVAGTINEGVRLRDGHFIRWDSGTNEFAICDPAGAVMTYFKPDPTIHKQGDNLAYFRRRLQQ